MKKRNLIATLIVATVATIYSCKKEVTESSANASTKVEQINTNNFHLVDFVGWNTNLTVPSCRFCGMEH